MVSDKAGIFDGLLPPDTPDGQRRAIAAGDSIISVGAGAGTGKTWVLSNRYARLLLTDDGLLPKDILTLTYTDAAANEMKRRIETRVNGLMEEPLFRVSPERKRAIRDGFSEAWISTIHSFASRLIRESGLSLDVDPRASVVTDAQKESFWDGIREAVEFAGMGELAASCLGGKHDKRGAPSGRDARLAAAAAALDADPLTGAEAACWGGEKLSQMARDAADLHASMGRNWEEMLDWADTLGADFFGAAPDVPLIREAEARVTALLRCEWTATWRLWGGVFDAIGDRIREKGLLDRESGRAGSSDEMLLSCLESFREGQPHAGDAPDDETMREFFLRVTDNRRLKGSSSRLMKEVNGFLGMTLAEWQKARAACVFPSLRAGAVSPFSDAERRLWASLLRFCAVSWGLWDAMKRRRGLLSFSDMILHARGAGKKFFRHILVDEFQDTDPLQFELIESLPASRGRAGGGSSLFAVGDPKQSIYRFRHADPSLFAGVMNRAGARVELDVSFRTRKALLERINDLFSHIWANGLAPEGTGPLSRLKFEPLSPAPHKAGEDRDGGTVPPFSVILAVKRENDVRKTRERLAAALARRVSSLVRGGTTVWDRDGRRIRPLAWGDFAVLVRSRGSHELLEQAFSAEDIPSVQDRSSGYMARGEVGDVISLLRAASDVDDDVAVAGWLMSPFSDVPEDEAVNILCSAPRGSDGARRTGVFELIGKELPDAAERLRYLSLVGQRQGASGLLSIFDRDRRWLAYYGNRVRALRNLRRAISIARGFEAENASGLAACADWMARAMRRGVAMDEPVWRDKGTDAVLLSSVHASKGLEYPVAVIFDAMTRSHGNGDYLRPSRDLGVRFPGLPDEMTPDSPYEEKPELLNPAWEKLLSSQGEHDEDMRLFYVAATRARDALLFCGILNGSNGVLSPAKGSWTSLLLDRMSQRGELDGAFSGPCVELVDDVVEDGAARRPAPEPPEEPRPASRPASGGVLLSGISATSFAMFTWCPVAWRRRYRMGLDLRWESPDRDLMMEDGDTMGGSELGSLAHWILSRWPSADGDHEKELERWLRDESTLRRLPSYLRDTWRDEESKDALRKWLLGFASSGAGLQLRNALNSGARREAKFRVALSGTADAGTELAGAMDAVWRVDGGQWRVLDYKITLSRNAPPGLYEAQMDFYALVVREAALEAGMPCSSVGVELVFLREGGRTERRNVDEGEFGGLKARALDMARRGAAGPYAPRAENCGACPWSRGCFAR